MKLTRSMFETPAQYWQARAELAERTVGQVATVLGIGCEARTPNVIIENVRNAVRRSDCLSRIEAHHTITVTDEYGDEMREELLNWGEQPGQYIETYRAVVSPDAQSGRPLCASD